jgi:hypothetical protein
MPVWSPNVKNILLLLNKSPLCSHHEGAVYRLTALGKRQKKVHKENSASGTEISHNIDRCGLEQLGHDINDVLSMQSTGSTSLGEGAREGLERRQRRERGREREGERN